MNNVRVPSVMVKGSNYHLFKDGIRPVSGVEVLCRVIGRAPANR